MGIFRGLPSRSLLVTVMLKNVDFFQVRRIQQSQFTASMRTSQLLLNQKTRVAARMMSYCSQALCEVSASLGKHCVSASCLLGYGNPAIFKWIKKELIISGVSAACRSLFSASAACRRCYSLSDSGGWSKMKVTF